MNRIVQSSGMSFYTFSFMHMAKKSYILRNQWFDFDNGKVLINYYFLKINQIFTSGQFVLNLEQHWHRGGISNTITIRKDEFHKEKIWQKFPGFGCLVRSAGTTYSEQVKRIYMRKKTLSA